MLKYLLLALLAKAPQHGYELKQSFEDMLGGTWLLNIGQVYTTLGRLEEDGLIEPTVVRQDLLPDRKVYSLTASQRHEYLDASTQIARRRAEPDLPAATGLILDGLLHRLEADLLWLDEA